jgi:protoporphyrinogen oxidase
MKVAVIGAGFTGLTAALRLSEAGNDVTVFEKDGHPGGLAIGYQEKNWDWTLEKHYHHWFTNDKFVLNLAREINHKVAIRRPKTSVYVNGHIHQFDSPKEVMLFPELSLIDRLRMGIIVGLLRYNPFWKPLEKINASTFLPQAMGKRAYKMIWEPLFKNKFGPYAADISLSWFWARIYKRTPSLAYPEGGFLTFANHLVEVIKQKGGRFNFNTEVLEVSDNDRISVKVKDNNGKIIKHEFDKVIFTLPSFLFLKTTLNLPDSYKKRFSKLKGLSATNLVLRLKKPFLPNNTYWLSVCERDNPIMAMVEHTNFMDKEYYDNEHLVYLGNYLPLNHPQYQMDKHELLKRFDPYLKMINPDYYKHLIGYELFKAPFAQPIVPTNYSKMIPPMTTPFANIYLANIEQVYPWDRGTNYAVELGEKVAKLINE